MRVAGLSDTHPPRRWTSCPPQAAARLRDVDVILHAGDVCTPDVLDELSSWAPEDWGSGGAASTTVRNPLRQSHSSHSADYSF